MVRFENRQSFTTFASSTKSRGVILDVAAKLQRSGATRRTSGAAASNLTLSAGREFDQTAGSDLGRAQRARRVSHG